MSRNLFIITSTKLTKDLPLITESTLNKQSLIKSGSNINGEIQSNDFGVEKQLKIVKASVLKAGTILTPESTIVVSKHFVNFLEAGSYVESSELGIGSVKSEVFHEILRKYNEMIDSKLKLSEDLDKLKTDYQNTISDFNGVKEGYQSRISSLQEKNYTLLSNENSTVVTEEIVDEEKFLIDESKKLKDNLLEKDKLLTNMENKLISIDKTFNDYSKRNGTNAQKIKDFLSTFRDDSIDLEDFKTLRSGISSILENTDNEINQSTNIVNELEAAYIDKIKTLEDKNIADSNKFEDDLIQSNLSIESLTNELKFKNKEIEILNEQKLNLTNELNEKINSTNELKSAFEKLYADLIEQTDKNKVITEENEFLKGDSKLKLSEMSNKYERLVSDFNMFIEKLTKQSESNSADLSEMTSKYQNAVDEMNELKIKSEYSKKVIENLEKELKEKEYNISVLKTLNSEKTEDESKKLLMDLEKHNEKLVADLDLLRKENAMLSEEISSLAYSYESLEDKLNTTNLFNTTLNDKQAKVEKVISLVRNSEHVDNCPDNECKILHLVKAFETLESKIIILKNANSDSNRIINTLVKEKETADFLINSLEDRLRILLDEKQTKLLPDLAAANQKIVKLMEEISAIGNERLSDNSETVNISDDFMMFDKETELSKLSKSITNERNIAKHYKEKFETLEKEIIVLVSEYETLTKQSNSYKLTIMDLELKLKLHDSRENNLENYVHASDNLRSMILSYDLKSKLSLKIRELEKCQEDITKAYFSYVKKQITAVEYQKLGLPLKEKKDKTNEEIENIIDALIAIVKM